jgi:SH3-like domain-containing protein
LPLPRFAALRSDDVNLRAGPGFRYPIEWVYKRRDLPMEIEREFEVWRLVAAPDGIRGWVHQATLTGVRTFMVQGADATLRAEPKDDATPVAVLKVGVIGRIRSCEASADWCRLQIGDYRGFLKRSQFWGALPDEVIAP